jgi:hypothetical protein
MLVLAMEFSRDAQRPGSDETSWGEAVRMHERPTA